MITWIVSFPKSGNTFLRLMLAEYFYSNNYDKNNFDLLSNISQYPNISLFKNLLNEKSSFYDFYFCRNYWYDHQKFLIKKNKLLLKTHNTFFHLESFFTTNEITKCAIYLIRDPRNVFLSLKDYIKEDDEKTLEYMLGDIFRSEYYKNNKVQHTHIGNWETNFLSWQKSLIHFPIKFVKYEDLVTNTKEEFLKILLFLKNYMDINIDTNKVNQIVENNSFEKLSKREKLSGFPEASYNGDSKFFNKGLARNYKKELSSSIIKQIEKKFYNTMLKFNYL